MPNNKLLKYLFCALLFLTSSLAGNAQSRNLPQAFFTFLQSPGMKHATVTFELVRLPLKPSEQKSTLDHPAIDRGEVTCSYDAERMMTPASVMKLVTAATGFRLLGSNYVWPDSIALIDTAAVALPGLECYNPDWLIEDIDTDYMPPLTNVLPDSGQMLIDVMRQTLQLSLNPQAETMLHLLSPSCRRDSALLVVQDYWANCGLDVESLVMYDGCGLSPSDRLTAHFVTSLLAEMQFDNDFRSALATAGKDGTVRRFLKGTRLDGRAQLKTGTLKNVVAYAGYVKGSDGRTYAMALFVSNSLCKHADTRKRIENILLSLIP